MRSFVAGFRGCALVCSALAVAGCHGHDHSSSERDTKGRSSAVIGAPAAPPVVAAPKPLRVIRRPLVVDVNGDGHDDAVVVVTSSGAPYTYAALDGMTGAVLWQSDALGSWSDPGYLVGHWLLVSTDAGELHGWDFKAPAPAWTTSLGERVTNLCEASDATQVRVLLADKRALLVELASGAQIPAPKTNTPCRPLRPNKSRGRSPDGPAPTPQVGDYFSCGTTTLITSAGRSSTPDPCPARTQTNLDALDGISVHALYMAKTGFVLIGTHRPGTAYPVVGFLSAHKLAWKSDVPLDNPLAADTGGPDNVELLGDELYVSYKAGRSWFVTAFNVTTGHRDWHVTSNYSRGMQLWASRDTLFGYIDTPDALVGLAADSGAQRFAVGRNY